MAIRRFSKKITTSLKNEEASFIEVLVVAGGGGGASDRGGAGGAGGLVYSNTGFIFGNKYVVSVGAGGALCCVMLWWVVPCRVDPFGVVSCCVVLCL